MNKRRRSTLELIRAILTVCKQPVSKTKIMLKVYLSWQQTNYYINELMNRHFIEKADTKYLITLIGKDFLEGLETLLGIWNNESAVMITA